MGKVVILLVKDIYYPILAAFGLPANLMTIVILSRGNCGLSKCITAYMGEKYNIIPETQYRYSGDQKDE
ncbi:hypothetical protein scyTo_0010026 [Scyliorhinus torazame]|uniref:Uncharacterized protein n=1 Tax=Scyliorhinus torazame TaxID=75743 RepID=A0A401NYG0_SCYTO|nr:hypothetical protein [Scyliorhinus torazame]